MNGKRADSPLNFGVFITPFHPVGQSPTHALQYDMDRVAALDRLGFDEAWFGEHHSDGYELIACPEVFIAAAAERTRHIRLGTGVVSLPYHHPLMVADRWVLLDHLTRGRVRFGTGPGALPSDAYMMGIDPVPQRPMMQESLEAVLALFRAGPTNGSTARRTGSPCATPHSTSGPTPGRIPKSPRRQWYPRPGRGWPACQARRCFRCRCRSQAAMPRWRPPGTW
jgi:alkanesulfonate monooxygenase SsuD/methylene tetrahydromethanopterin reductase-like flavin-dependent oxidoreductase (luciferase family)